MTYPSMRDARAAELALPDVARTLEVLLGPSGTHGLCRPGEVLVSGIGHEELRFELTDRLGRDPGPDDDLNDEAPVKGSWRNPGPDAWGRSFHDLNQILEESTGLRLVTFGNGFQVADLVAAVRARIDARPEEGSIHPNRVLTGEPVYMGGPGKEPELAAPVSIDSALGPGEVADIAVLDTGIVSSVQHPWLGNVVIPDPNDTDPLFRPDHSLATQAGHGLFICGIVTRSTEGSLRIDPGRVLNQYGLGDDHSVSIELHEVTAPVINLSWGCFADQFGPPPALKKIIAGLVAEGKHVVVAAAGNNASDHEFYPAAFDDVIAVGALDKGNTPLKRADFSNHGPTWVDVWSRGVDLVSAYVTGPYPVHDQPLPLDFEDEYASWSGTSFAAPIVAARIAQLCKDELRKVAPRAPGQVATEFMNGLPQELVQDAGPDPVKVYIPTPDLTA